MKGAWLFEARPDLFPQGRLTPLETELWSLFLGEQQARQTSPKH